MGRPSTRLNVPPVATVSDDRESAVPHRRPRPPAGAGGAPRGPRGGGAVAGPPRPLGGGGGHPRRPPPPPATLGLDDDGGVLRGGDSRAERTENHEHESAHSSHPG